MDCNACKQNRKNTEPVPYIAHESAMARQERTIKRLWISLLVSICLWAATVGGVVYYNAQYEDVSVTQEVDTGDGSAFISGVGDVNYGESQTDG